MTKQQDDSKRKFDLFLLAILHLADMYGEQYEERGLCLSSEQNNVSFDEFVDQYYCARIRGECIMPTINPNVPLSYVRHNWLEDSRLSKINSNNPFT